MKKIRKIEILRKERRFEAVINDNLSYIIKPSKGRRVKKYDFLFEVALWMYKNNHCESDIRKFPITFWAEVAAYKSARDYKTIYSQWTTYKNIQKYNSTNSPFTLYLKKSNKETQVIDNKEKHNFALLFFHNEGKTDKDITRYWIGNKDASTEIEFKPEITEKPEEILFTQNNKEYIQFLKKTKDLDYKSLIDLADGFGIQEPSNGFFKDLYSIPIPEQANLKKLIENHKNVLITGKSKVGKTRLVFDVLKKLKNYYVLSLNFSAFTNVATLKISDFFVQKGKKLIWFIDNIDCYPFPLQDPIWDIYAKLCAIDKNTIVIATLRDDMKKPKSRLLENKRMEPLEFRYKLEDTEANNFRNHYYKGKDLPYHYDGTFWSIMYDIQYMKDLYNDDDKIDGTCRGIMKSLKLLQKILPNIEYTLLKVTFENIYHSFKGTTAFEDSIKKLDKIKFLKVDKSKNVVSAQEPYLEKIVDYPDMDSDMEKLIDIWMNSGTLIGLLALGHYYYHRTNFDNCIKCNQHVAANASSANNLKSLAYYTLGTVLSEIAKLQESKEKQLEYYNAACKKYKKAIYYEKTFAIAYYHWSVTFHKIIKLQDSKEDQRELCRVSYPMLFKSYLVIIILQDNGGPADILIEIIKDIHQRIDITIPIEDILTFARGLKASLRGNKKSFSKVQFNCLQRLKGISGVDNIIIDDILENKKPNVAENPDDDLSLTLATACFLVNDIIDAK